MTFTKPQPGPNEFLYNGQKLYAFFTFDKDPEGTEFWEVNQIVSTDGDTIVHPCDYGTQMPPRDFTLPECQQIWEVMEETFYPE